MAGDRTCAQRGQAIVLVGLLLVVLFGFVGLAIDGGRAYLDRRQMQASVDAASLAAAYDYMTSNDVGHAELAGRDVYATNERLYMGPTCTSSALTTTSKKDRTPADSNTVSNS